MSCSAARSQRVYVSATANYLGQRMRFICMRSSIPVPEVHLSCLYCNITSK
jgi:hypothetical protein